MTSLGNYFDHLTQLCIFPMVPPFSITSIWSLSFLSRPALDYHSPIISHSLSKGDALPPPMMVASIFYSFHTAPHSSEDYFIIIQKSTLRVRTSFCSVFVQHLVQQGSGQCLGLLGTTITYILYQSLILNMTGISAWNHEPETVKDDKPCFVGNVTDSSSPIILASSLSSTISYSKDSTTGESLSNKIIMCTDCKLLHSCRYPDRCLSSGIPLCRSTN